MRKQIVTYARSLFERGFVVGSAGNISVKMEDGSFLATPTGSSFGTITEAEVSHFDQSGKLLSGKPPTKEVFLHLACYDVHPEVQAVVHLHSTYSTLLASLEGLSDGTPIRPFTPYFVMKVGGVGVLPYRKPGDKRLGDDIRQKSAFSTLLMANHGLIVCRPSLKEAVEASEEFEETAKLWYLGQHLAIRYLSDEEMEALRS
ncbi:MAG: aldolase [Sphaerochaeta sp.]|jgi:ribulose-5-phosphate 4-epimerase/fuculose-1-phosphate aldolase|nr:aldolase [Sphaerochaeta sp.]